MNYNNQKIISEIEFIEFGARPEMTVFKKFGHVYINTIDYGKNDKLKKLSVLKNKKINLKELFKFFLSLIGFNFKGLKFFECIGLKISWYFLPKFKILSTASVLYEYQSLVMFYVEKNKLYKTCTFDKQWHKGIIKEIKLQKLAMQAFDKTEIRIPKVIDYNTQIHQVYFSQELIFGKELSAFNNRLKEQVYDIVFKNMFRFYETQEIEIESVSRNGKYFNLIKAYTHNDLKDTNILLTENENIVVIDWLGAKRNYVFKEYKIEHSIYFDTYVNSLKKNIATWKEHQNLLNKK